MDAFLHWWQHLPSHMDPVIFQIGSFRLQWYGLMYILAFATVYFLASFRLKREPRFPYDDEFLKNILTYGFIGVLVGGRLGYVLFYNLGYYLGHPLEIILPFRMVDGDLRFTGISGMSYHGGVMGALAACALFTRRYGANYWNLSDLFFPVAALGYTFGRLGNFINGELYGRVTEAPIGMHFPGSPDPTVLRHPSQLYEAFFEGIFLFLVLWNLRRLRLPQGSMAAFYLSGYGFVRFFIEFFREPDTHLGFVLFRLSMGQILCFAMMLAGGALFVHLYRTQPRLGLASGPAVAGEAASQADEAQPADADHATRAGKPASGEKRRKKDKASRRG